VVCPLVLTHLAEHLGNKIWLMEAHTFYVLLILHLSSILVNNQLDTQFFFFCIYIFFQFSTPLSSSSGESNVLIGYLVYVTSCRWPSGVQVWMELLQPCRTSSIRTCPLDGHLHRVTYTRYHIDTTDSPDDEHTGARNM